jgi:hypothetical protein
MSSKSTHQALFEELYNSKTPIDLQLISIVNPQFLSLISNMNNLIRLELPLTAENIYKHSKDAEVLTMFMHFLNRMDS